MPSFCFRRKENRSINDTINDMNDVFIKHFPNSKYEDYNSQDTVVYHHDLPENKAITIMFAKDMGTPFYWTDSTSAFFEKYVGDILAIYHSFNGDDEFIREIKETGENPVPKLRYEDGECNPNIKLEKRYVKLTPLE